jgi:uncharacterized membrane protein
MKRMNLKRTLSATIFICGTLLAASALAESQGGNGPSGMMGGYGAGWMGGNGFGGVWLLILIVVVVAGIVAWMVAKNKK